MSRIFCYQIRNSSTKSQKSAQSLINFNYENKALYGSIKKRKKEISGKPEVEKTSANDVSSEIYWLLRHKQFTPVEAVSKSELDFELSNGKPTLSISSIGDTLKTLRPVILPPPELKHSTKSPFTDVEPIAIPFTNKELKSILKYPMVSNHADGVVETVATIEFRYPSVGKILQATMSEGVRKALIKWKLDKMKELGEEGFNQLQQNQLSGGKLFHEALDTYFTTGTAPAHDSAGYKIWGSITPALESLRPQVQFSEKMIEHPYLKYRGIVDCVSTVSSETAVIEWKKSDKLKSTLNATFDAPLQLCAYLGALSADPQYNLKATKGFVVVAYTDGQPAQIHQLNVTALKKYWQLWLQRLQEFWIRTRDGTLPEPI